MEFELPKIYIMRVGDPSKNFERSVTSRLNTNTPSPIWGYESMKCGGFRNYSLKIHTQLMQSIVDNNYIYVYFKSWKKGSLIGLAKVSNVYPRELVIDITAGNRINGWNTPTCFGSVNWDMQFDIDTYWDLTTIRNSAFNHDTIYSNSILTQCSIFPLSNAIKPALYEHLQRQTNLVIEYTAPVYEN